MVRDVGALAIFAGGGLSGLLRRPFYWRVFLTNFFEIVYYSLPVVALAAIFSGGVIALQSYTGFAQYHAQGAIGGIVVLAVTRELGPVLAGLMVAGRAGVAMAAEIGTMRVTDQIDALKTLAVETDALPRDTTPAGRDLGPASYVVTTLNVVTALDVWVGLAKAAVFGFLIALLGCYHDYSSRGGAEGVGAATTAAVVGASNLLLAFDYLLTDLFLTNDIST
ncbi:MAG: ABC transporter permease [Acetobacteraceae bacterium]